MRKTLVFRNYDKIAIKKLLKEIGKYKFETECENRHIPVPMNMKGFYLESKIDCTLLVYQFPLTHVTYMKVDHYDLPVNGWELVQPK